MRRIAIDMSDSHTSFDSIVSRLRDEFPGVTLLALGQTVYWDEPMKSILRRRLDETYPAATMLVGIHDADYFSKVSGSLCLSKGWSILPHTDGATKDLWVATGEISSLFGSETFPTRDVFTNYGVQFDKIARSYPGGRDALIETATEAAGWRGLVHVGVENEIACCVSLRDALPHLLELLEWGFSHTLDMLSDADAARGKPIADELLAEVREYAETHPDASITQMFREFLHEFYVRSLGYEPSNLGLTAMTELFAFNRSTAGLPRFKLLAAFLDPATRAACQESYDLAVEGSDIYTLDRFCDGAIPFDLVIPGRGRGTICLSGGAVVVDGDEPITLTTNSHPTTPEELAALVEDKLGTGVALVGKAVTLILMMASEFIFVLHEQASSYVPSCEKMATLMRERGIDLPYYPILRIDYHTWDSVVACDATFRLPGHLAIAFRQSEITSTEFADLWRGVVRDQEQLLSKLQRMTDIDLLLTFLAEQHGEPWPARIQEYMAAYTIVRKLSGQTGPMKDESVRLRDLSHEIKAQVQQLEIEKGEHFRTRVRPLRDEIEAGASGLADQLRTEEQVREDFERRILEKREEANNAHNRSIELKHAVRDVEKGAEMLKARETLNTIEYEAELARLWMVRDAFLVTKGLDYTDHRPSAWWFMLVDPELKWFNRVAETAEYRWEEVQGNG
jgi:hypothetical protein